MTPTTTSPLIDQTHQASGNPGGNGDAHQGNGHIDMDALPGPGTPGWRLVSPRAVQVLVTIAARIRARKIAHGHGVGLVVAQLADWCGVRRAAIGAALAELRDLGWVGVEYLRGADGRAAGVECRLLPPPATLADAAVERYAMRLARRRERDAEARATLARELRGVRPALAEQVQRVLGDDRAVALVTEADALGRELAAAVAERGELVGRLERLTGVGDRDVA